jgi:hypothetical protein
MTSITNKDYSHCCAHVHQLNQTLFQSFNRMIEMPRIVLHHDLRNKSEYLANQPLGQAISVDGETRK